METVFFESAEDRHAQLVGGVTALERRVREVAKQGATRAVVAGAQVAFPRALPIPVEFVAPGSPAPEGARRERADVVAGIELVDAEANRRAEWALIRGLNKSFQGPVDALINWRFSMRITRMLARRSLAITPNHVTMLSILVGITASLLILQRSYATLALGGVLLEVQSILDSVDGELARLRFQYSKLGQWLDNLSDDVVDNLFIISAGSLVGGAWLWVAIVAAGARLLNNVVQYLDTYRRTGTGDAFAFRYWFEKETASADELYKPADLSTWLRSLGRRDTYVFMWMLACVCNFPYWVVGHAVVIAAIVITLLVAHYAIKASRRRR